MLRGLLRVLDDAWASDASPEQVVASLGTWAAAAIAGWLVVGSVLYVAATARRDDRAARCVGALLPGVRPLLDRLLALGLASVTILSAAPAGAAGEATATTTTPTTIGSDAAIVLSQAPDGRFVVSSPSSTPPTAHPEVTPPTTTTTTAPRAQPDLDGAHVRPIATPDVARHIHRVVAGDNLWRIAAATLSDAWRRAPSDAEIVPYWRTVCDQNRPTLRSRDPNLIFPGELVALPEPPAVP